jgi:hypothetical protein
MTPIEFSQANSAFKAPNDLDESQCFTIPAHQRIIVGGNLDGARQVIVAWKPTELDLERLNKGEPIFISMLGGLAPHFLTTTFEEALSVGL